MAEEATGFSAAVEAEGKPVAMNGEEDERNSLSASSQVDSSGSEDGTESSSHDVTDQKQPPLNPAFLVKDRVKLQGLKQDMWKEEHEEQISVFYHDPSVRLLVAYIDQVNGLTVSTAIPNYIVDELAYFLKDENVELTVEDFPKLVQCGTAKSSGTIDSLLRLMQSLYGPTFFTNSSWPDGVRNDLSSHVHRFLSHLTDNKHKGRQTVLYVPNEGPRMSQTNAHKIKELVQRLETVMIHWTRQIKEILSSQETVDTSVNAGPLQEIEFWNRRCEDLTGLTKQLEKPGVQRVKGILEQAKSSYVAPFVKLTKQIQEGRGKADSNLRFLSLLSAPCTELATAEPKKIPDLLPRLLSVIRFIWVNSEHYKSRERLTGLFRKVSNEIIRRCAEKINVDDIFEGRILSSMEVLDESILCCEAWKDSYSKASLLHNKFSEEKWILDQNSIFAQVDAFVQRCKDLLDVCEGQVHFARWQDGEKTPLPLFHGCRSSDIRRNLLEIESTFDKNLWILRNVKKSILDVKATSWHDDYNRFRLGVKDLESMVQNVILSAFETVATVEDGVELLDIFVHLSSREPIRRTLDKKTTEVWLMFDRELVAVKKELNAKRPFLTRLQPRFSGVALWARMLKRRIDNSMQVLENSRDFLPPAGVGDEARAQYKQLAQALEEFVSKMFDEWASTVSHDQLKKLEVPLMARSSIKAPMLDIRFDSSLLRLFGEIRYWERLTFEIPHYASDVYTRREELRVLRENVLLVARDYNRVLVMLSQEERGLFQERIKTLDKKIHPGLTKLTWASKGISDYFLAECRKSAAQVQAVVDSYKDTNQAIRKHCRSVSEMLLVRIDGKRPYQNDEFENDQEKHRQSVTEKLKKIHEKIVKDMKRTYEVFRKDNTEVQGHWYSYTEKMDRLVEEAFRLNVKWSLLELSRAINGDGKTSPNSLFRVRVVLEGKPQKVDFSPTLERLAGMVNKVAEGLTVCASIIQRLPDLLTKSRSQKEPIYVVIENDEETRKVQQNIKAGMASNAAHLADYLKRWDGYRDIYEISKDAFIRRYQRLSPPVSSFDGDIQRYSELSNNVQKEDTMLNIEFVLLDCSPLKFALVQHCNEWQNKFTSLLQEMATKQLDDLHSCLTGNAKKLSVPPQTLDELGDSLMLLEKMQTDLKDTEARFAPLHEQFNILEKYEVAIPEETLDTLENLNNEWMIFQQSLIDGDAMLKKHKEKFRSGLLHDAEELKRTVAALCEDFATKGPFTSAIAVPEALEFVQQTRTQLASLKLQEAQVRRGLAIFKIEHPPSREVQNLDKDLDSLEAIWELVREWEASWDAWKRDKFKELVTDKMETSAQGMLKRCVRMNRELKEKNWEIIENLRRRIEQLKRTMPLVQALKNPAMRDRHWTQLKTEVQKPFDEESDDFTLERIIQLGLDEFADAISEISGAASKELGIETALNDIKLKWDDLSLDIGPYKERGHFRLKATDEIFQTLEDNQVSLSTMKASRYVKAFESEVDRWERTLSHILECTEMILTVQRQWMYLENIFVGEDIRNQLPNESAMFDDVNGKWKTIMTRLNEERNALKGTHAEGLLETLSEMNVHLEEIQKSLDMYLETKRNVFPRFYFLSNDDLLEILGQSKNPEAVQPHLKKCFDNIVRLKLHKVRDKNEASCMMSADGEEVDFQQAVLLEGAVESWLGTVERYMRLTLKEVLKACKTALKKQTSKRERWVKEWPGQMLLTASQIQWTADCTKALKSMKERGDKKGLRSMKKKQIAMLGKFSESLRGNLTKLQRLKVVALVTIEVHARDVIERLIKAGCSDVNAFEWLMQLRLYWDEQIDDCIARQTNTQFRYGYEYLGNSGRLVITPLTDRCYMTLTTALHLHRGGSPKGPAGTGKTETVKDLGKALGAYVIVVNCSEGLDYKSMGRMFSGLAQTGAWGCFDEFNRINIEVLSVVAQQILSILQALSRNADKFMFEGRSIKLVWSCGIFITMNPGYAGRTELPDNLKSMFRPISMMVPDSRLIAEIILFGEGFGNCKVLANKVFTLYCLAVQQLSKQDHYDFGLRALVSVLRYGGRKRRTNPTMPEEEVLLLAMKDMNVAKLTSVDLPLFNGIISDLFPGVETPVLDYNKMYAAIKVELKLDGLQAASITLLKVIQLFETKNSRHSTMIVGETGSGKSTVWRILQRSLTRLHKEQDEENKRERKDVANPWHRVHAYPINPKAVSLGELYGEFDLNTNEWTDGILSTVMRLACADERPDQKWIVFDAPVDTLWIESMNSVMDDNKILTLINGERISMPEQVSLLIETQDLAVASPATVSRCGMVFLDTVDLGWRPYVESWLQKHENRQLAEHLQRLFDKFVDKLLVFRQKSCKELVPTAQLNSVISLCTLFNALATPENGVNPEDAEHYLRMVELWFLFSMIWSICASVDEQSRKKMDNYIRELEGQFPSKDTVYEYYVDVKQKGWALWEEKLRSGWRYNAALPFYKIVVPTVDTVRYDFIVHSLISARRPVLLVGPVGTGKTSVAQSVLSKLDPRIYSVLTINMSAQTSSSNVQEIIESKVEKRTKGVFVPSGGKKMITFLDDLNMPTKDTFGSQPPLELLRMWLDYGFWYDRLKQTKKEIRDMFLLAAMGPPGGGRQVISRRLQSRFNLLNMTFPHESQIRRIFGTMINQKLQDFEEDVKPIGDVMTQATVEIYEMISTRMLPTPTKIHYLFNLRDISKVFQGLLRAHKDYHDTKAAMTRLWVHECFRVFSDRLVDSKDAETFKDMLNEKLGTQFDVSFHNLCPNKQSPIFGDFLRVDNAVYEDIIDFKQLKSFMEGSLEDYNNTAGVIAMELVLFKDAIEHVCRVVRVIRQPRGNMLLVGIGGSGRQSLSRLASYILEYEVFQIEVSRHYRKTEFREDLRKLYFMAGVENKPTVFLFTDTQVVEEAFLEDINNILSSGEVPNLYKPEEFEEVRTALADIAKKEGILNVPDVIFAYFIERVRNNLHVVLCMSPVGEPFRNRIRQYPAFVNCTTIDWFSEWPKDALLEVSERYLEEVNLGTGDAAVELKKSVAQIFVTVHRSVVDKSRQMLLEMKRYNYVTPTNYLELVSGYKRLLEEKRKELGDAASKLKNGLFKLDETREKVQAMSLELEEAKVKVADYQKQCEEYLVVIVQQKREADEQQKAVGARSEKIGEEEAECKKIAANAQRDLEAALPALEEAMKALEALNKKDLTEIKSYGSPPELVGRVLQAVMILRGAEPTWAEAKRQLSDPNFIKQLINFDRDNMSDRMLKKINGYTSQQDFKPEIIGRVSQAARSLSLWVIAMEVYGKVFRVVQPKREKLAEATKKLEKAQAQLADAKAKLQEVQDKIEELKRQYDEKLAQKEELRRKAEETELKLERAGKLVSGLAGERERWEASVGDLEEQIGYLVGDCLVASACLSYIGPFLSQYRDELVQKTWLKQVRELNIPCNPEFTFALFLSRPTTVRGWNIQGLPSDSFSTENGVIVTRGSRWPLMVDPQGQAMKWVKNMEGKRLKIIDLQQPDFLRTLENSIQFGSPVLLQNVQEELDPSLAPVLNKSIFKVAGRLVIRLGDKEVDYSPDFKFYITTKLSNPHYTPEISTKTTIVNFAVKEQGLEAQLLGIVVRKERPDLEEKKGELVVNIANGKKRLEELEDEILRLLSTAQGSLLDDEKLVETLQSSKTTALEVAEQLQVSEQTEVKIDAAREGYRPCAQRASILFFVLNDMGRIDPMYQFSLDAYIELFNMSIDKSQKSTKLDERIKSLNDHHTYAVYRYTCRGLFERHKLLFSFQMCAKILEAAGKLNMEEYNFFLRGGIVLDRETQMDNPCTDWLPDTCWDHITELDKLSSFQGISNSFEQNGRAWRQWYTAAEPETSVLPGEWENSLNELQRMLVVRSLRSDRVQFCATSFIVNNLGPKFVEPPVLDMKSVVDDSNCRTPLIFVLSPGVDPTSALLQLAEHSKMSDRFQALSLGQGQAPIAKRMFKTGVKDGDWVFLANCHLSLSWMPELDKLVEQLQTEEPHKDFRLWLSSSPHPDFPISILQAGIKMTTEPPKGLKANMKRLYQLVTDEQFSKCHKPDKYKKLLFSLAFFHSVLIERRKFGMLGWNVFYGFNDSDFEVSENLLSIYLDEYEETQWDALKYLIAEVNYGGHVTDDWDRRLLLTYINNLFCDGALSSPFYKLSSLPTYYLPRDGPFNSYRDYIHQLPNIDHPEAFGQNPNADISSQIRETRALFETLLSLQPQISVSERASSEDKVLELAAEVQTKVPEEIDYEQTVKLLAEDPSPLNVVLLQEIERYNALVATIRTSLVELEKAIKGVVVMSSDLDETFSCIQDARVPPLWEKAYPSLKPLGPWTRDLQQRVEQFAEWAKTTRPPHIFWLSGFTFPTGFLTAVLQTAARQNNVSVDTLSWEFHVSTLDDSNITGPPKDGVWIRGLYLEGAGWDKKNSCLIEASPMQLVCPVPSIHFKPAENKKKAGKGTYACPCYYYSNRSGTSGRPSFVVGVELKAGAFTSDHWIKRAVALLMSLDY